MLRGGPQFSAQDNSKQQQKQKKRLSFREPEVEGPLKNYLNAGCRSKSTLTKPTKSTNPRKTSTSVEDLTLEDRALQIAHNVGNAFSDLSITDNELVDFSGPESLQDFETTKETEIRDSSPTEFESYQQSCQFRSFKISADDREFSDAIIPPLQERTMRGPSFEKSDSISPKNCIPVDTPAFHEYRPSSSTQHQIQMLRYQLDQQNQQTQMAMHQVQMLQDQMEAESVARRNAQEQNNQLMQQNKDLLSHMEKLFQQIEDLEKNIQILEQEKRGRKFASSQESQITSLRQPTTYATSRRPSYEQLDNKSVLQNRTSYATARKNSLTSSKPQGAISKTTTNQNSTPTPAPKKTPSISSKPLSFQNKSKDSGAKEKETLRIGDLSPPVLTGTANPTTSPWKLKAPDSSSTQSSADKSMWNAVRSRTGSFTSYIKKQEGDSAKSTLFGSNSNSLSSTSITGKKYSLSTSDLYSTGGTTQDKSSLMLDDPSASVKSAVSNLNVSTTSKLPRYQPYTGWSRRTSFSSESDQVSAVGKDSYKNPPKTFLFNR